jgi:hypothetical protein
VVYAFGFLYKLLLGGSKLKTKKKKEEKKEKKERRKKERIRKKKEKKRKTEEKSRRERSLNPGKRIEGIPPTGNGSTLPFFSFQGLMEGTSQLNAVTAGF